MKRRIIFRREGKQLLSSDGGAAKITEWRLPILHGTVFTALAKGYRMKWETK
jgi:hypothetical protein